MIVEFGAGTGSATFLPARTVSVEFSKFYVLLQERFPKREIVHMDAIEYLAASQHRLLNPIDQQSQWRTI